MVAQVNLITLLTSNLTLLFYSLYKTILPYSLVPSAFTFMHLKQFLNICYKLGIMSSSKDTAVTKVEIKAILMETNRTKELKKCRQSDFLLLLAKNLLVI